jgi:prepilin-type processing-associated H-X9-DG protein/prepilin-type N-terminal cleavage/methylation domain-containing protein
VKGENQLTATWLPQKGLDSMLCPCASRRPSAFSLLELLVVSAVLAVLLGLLLPAIQKVREAANRTACTNNLRQIGLALHHYHDVHRTFPPGGIEWRPPGNSSKRQLAWCVFLLPYLEQDKLYRRLNLNKPFDSPENAQGAAAVLPVFLCPSKPRTTYRFAGRGLCDYGGILGQALFGNNNPPNGTMLFDKHISIAMITDGTAHTLMISEDTQRDDGQWINAMNLFDVAFPINRGPVYDPDIHSEHSGGANGLFADGSVRFLRETMEVSVLAAIVTRAGGEPVPDDF